MQKNIYIKSGNGIHAGPKIEVKFHKSFKIQ